MNTDYEYDDEVPTDTVVRKARAHLVCVSEGGMWLALFLDDRNLYVDSLEFGATAPAWKLRVAYPELDEIFVHCNDDLYSEERTAMLDAAWIPAWASRAGRTAQRLAALIEAAINGRPWARPYVCGSGLADYPGHLRSDEAPIIEVEAKAWASALGVTEAEATGAFMELEFLRCDDRLWCFNT